MCRQLYYVLTYVMATKKNDVHRRYNCMLQICLFHDPAVGSANISVCDLSDRPICQHVRWRARDIHGIIWILLQLTSSPFTFFFFGNYGRQFGCSWRETVQSDVFNVGVDDADDCRKVTCTMIARRQSCRDGTVYSEISTIVTVATDGRDVICLCCCYFNIFRL